MANLQNLRPIDNSQRSHEEHSESSRKGGKASGEARRKKKLLRETLEMLLEMEDKKGRTGQDAICVALFKRANAGDTKAFEIIRDTIGQKPIEKIEKTERPIIKDDI